jgi:hypothetical protein
MDGLTGRLQENGLQERQQAIMLSAKAVAVATAPPRGSMRPGGGITVLNRFERSSPMAGEAEVKYLDGDFRVVRPGAFVRCAVTGAPIPLEELKYWSVDLQEAYSSPEAVLQRHFPEGTRHS